MIAKSRKIAYYSLVFFGIFGVHRFYLKKPYAILLLLNGLLCIACLFYMVKTTGAEYLLLAQQLNPELSLQSSANHLSSSAAHSVFNSNLSGLNGMQGRVDITKFDPLLMWANVLYMLTSIIALAVCAFDLFQIPKWIPRGHYYDNVTRGYTVQ